jgi:hypothetical protein
MKPQPGIAQRSLVPIVVGLLAWGHITQAAFHWDCPIRTLLHFPCPTCGMTTAARAMLHLHFAQATRVHPLALVVVPFVAVLVTVELAGYVWTGRFGVYTSNRAVRIAGFAMCAALFVVWIARLGAVTPS